MTDWKYNLYLADLRDEFEKDEFENADIKKCVTTICNRLKLLKLVILNDDDDAGSIIDGPSGLDYYIDEFEYFGFEGSRQDQLNAFNDLFDDLYNFADWEFIWINVTDENMNGIGKP